VSARTLRLVADESAVGPAASDVETVVLDTAWTAPIGSRPDVTGLRPIAAAALGRHQPLEEALALVDGWAAAAGAVEACTVSGASLWYRRRVHTWRWLETRLAWRWVLEELETRGPIGRLELPAGEPELRDVAGAMARDRGWDLAVPADPGAASPIATDRRFPWPLDPILWRIGLHPARRTRAATEQATTERHRQLGELVDRLADRRTVLVPVDPAVRQTVGVDGSVDRRDAALESVLEALVAAGVQPVLVDLGRSPAGPRAVRTPAEVVIPASLLATRYADPADDAAVASGAEEVGRRVRALGGPLELGGIDLGPALAADLGTWVGSGLAGELRAANRIARLIGALAPAAVLMINEYSRPEWILAAHRQGVPVGAVQHGIIHRWHPGYMLPDRTGLPLADRTYVFGEFESRLLTAESVYRDTEVLVAGSPRLDLLPPVPVDPSERRRIRDRLGVSSTDRLVVLSSSSLAAGRRFAIAAALERLLDRQLPGVHLVVKLHPAEDDGTWYRRFVDGLGAGRGFAPPPMTVTRDVDLYGLLAAADAHVGVFSTVLTDAVVAGTLNLIVTSLAGSDLLGYVRAGVARPVRDGGDVLDVLGSATAPDADGARAAFLADHFRPGPAGERIARDLLEGIGI
jgi:hypothetical protein